MNLSDFIHEIDTLESLIKINNNARCEIIDNVNALRNEMKDSGFDPDQIDICFKPIYDALWLTQLL